MHSFPHKDIRFNQGSLAGMTNILLWYVPQALLVIYGFWITQDLDPPISGFASFMTGVFAAAAYTGAVNLFLSLRAKWIARRRGDRREPASDLRGEGTPPRLRR